MEIRMKLLSDTIFGNGMSVPGGEDISVQADKYGYPYFKGSTLKGLFREHFELYCQWIKQEDAQKSMEALLGKEGVDTLNPRKLIFSDLTLSDSFKRSIEEEIKDESGEIDSNTILNLLTNIRTFTAIDENGKVKRGSLRQARCVNRYLCFYGNIEVLDEDKKIVKEVLGLIKSVGTLRNRGFGSVKIEVVR